MVRDTFVCGDTCVCVCMCVYVCVCVFVCVCMHVCVLRAQALRLNMRRKMNGLGVRVSAQTL